MKKSSALLIAAALILSSCGTVAQYASSDNGQKFKDGIYSNTPAFRTKAEKVQSESETQSLVEKTQASAVYLFGDKKDTVMIPDDMSAMIRYDQKLGGTVVTIGENPYDWRYDLENNYGYWYGPYSIGSSWYWSRHYSPWYSWNFAPWRYRGWYDPWYYGGFYDPWYYTGYWGWYDPWYYGGFYDPWHYHYYAGWYGGWDPYWGHHHHHHHHGPDGLGHHKDVWFGSRHQTGSDRVFGSSSSLRGGIGSRNTVSRNETEGRASSVTRAQSSTGRLVPDRVAPGGNTGRGTAVKSASSNRTSIVRTTPTVRNNEVTASRPVGRPVASAPGRTTATAASGTSVSRPVGTVSRQPAAVQSNHRRPVSASSISGTVERGEAVSGSSSGQYRGATSATRSSTFDRGTNSARSSSSFERSSSSSSGRSSFSGGSGGGYSRSSSGGGGGYSRSGGSAGGRR